MSKRYFKYLTDYEFNLIMSEVKKRDSKPFEICLKFMCYLGLRVSDATQLKLDNISPDISELQYIDQKTKVHQQKAIPDFFSVEIFEYIKEYKKEFINNYLFPPLHNRVSKNEHIQPCTFRHFFKTFRRKHNLDHPYKITSTGMKLYRISTHTLKHYCLYKLYKASNNDLMFIKIFSGHIEMKHTIRYLSHEDFRSRQQEILNKAFS